MRVTEKSRPKRGPRRVRRLPRILPDRLPVADLVAFGTLALALVALLAFIALAPPTALGFPVDRQPPQVELRDLYGLERNSAGAYRWSKPTAGLTVPLAAPGDYRLTLVLQDAPDLPAPRTVALLVDGVAVETIALSAAPRPYSVVAHVSPARWAGEGGRTLALSWATAPYLAPGDARPLGPILTAVAIEPAARAALPDPALLVPGLLLLLLGYGALRRFGATAARAAVAPGLVLAGGALLAGLDRSGALLLAYRTIARPIFALGVLLLLAPLLVAAPGRAWATPGAGGRAFWSRRSLPVLPVAVLALGLRLWRIDRLSLWLDEGYTVGFARLPWATLLGPREQYDVHPPLYYALTKLATALVAEVHAGRLVSVLAGTLTVAVGYALAARLVPRGAALLAALVLALSPIHVWFSQEARMYALACLFVALSYLALLGAGQERARGWFALYGLAVLLALYTDTSALYALVPQVALWLLLARDDWRRALALGGAASLAGLAYLPWLLPRLATLGTATGRQESYLAVSAEKFAQTALAILGIGGGGTSDGALDYWGEARTPWATWPAARLPLLGLILLAVVVAAVLAARRGGSAPPTVAALGAGTFGAATLVSLVAPGFSTRTLLYAACGWALLAGAACAAAWPRRTRAALVAAVCLPLLLSTLTLGAVLQTGTKQGYRELAVATAGAVGGARVPLLTNDGVTETLLGVYAPQVLAARHAAVSIDTLDAVVAPYLREPGALWFAYGDYPWLDSRLIAERLLALGFERRSQQYFRGSLYLDLYARPGVAIVGGSPDTRAPSPPARPAACRFSLVTEGDARG